VAKFAGRVGLVRKPVRVLRKGKVFIRHQWKKLKEEITPLLKRTKREESPQKETKIQ
jgi:hypothetical protein